MSATVNELVTKADPISKVVIGAAIEVHRHLGPGLLESAYQSCLAHELNSQGVRFLREVTLPVTYKGTLLDCGYRMDFVVEDLLVLEIKAVESLSKIHEAQLLSYLRLSGKPLGLLINFHVPLLRDGIKRLAL
jgi:GxxExxY protein